MTRLILLLFTLSGMCALIYQLLWTRWLGLLLGNFALSTATVVTTFMAGLALGNWFIGRYSTKFTPSESLRLYAVLEGALALFAAASPLLFATSSFVYPMLASVSPTAMVRALVCIIILLPPTFLMGCTLPILVQTLKATSPAALGVVYALNTLGGAVGPLLAAFLMMPVLGLKLTLFMTVLVNASVAAAAFAASRVLGETAPDTPQPPGKKEPQAPSAAGGGLEIPRLLPFGLAAFAGFLSLAFEIALTRLLILAVTGGSVYGFAIILSAFLFGLAAGSLLIKRFPPRTVSGALTVFAGAQAVAWLFSLTTPFWDHIPIAMVKIWWSSLSFPVITAANFAVIIALLLTLTVAFGYSLPALAMALNPPTSAAIGRLFAANTVGAMLGAPVAGFLLLPSVGLNPSLLILGNMALAMAAVALVITRPRLKLAVLLPLPFLVGLSFFIPPPDDAVLSAGMHNRPLSFKPGMETAAASPVEAAHYLGGIRYQKDSLSGRITVRQGNPLQISFVVNGKPDGSTSLTDMHTQIVVAHLPALAHPDPRRALVIGLGTGTTVGCLALHPGIEEIHVVEIDPAIVEVARIFGRHNYDCVNNPKVKIHFDDARHYLLTEKKKFDIIISEPSNLFVSGMVNLFTREFYETAKKRLAPGGYFMQWLHYYRIFPGDLKGMLKTYAEVFPETTFWVHRYGDGFMLATDGEFKLDSARWQKRLSLPLISQDLKRILISPPEKILSLFLWTSRDVREYSRRGTPVTDDNPYLEFTTPRLRYSPQSVQELRTEIQSYGPLAPMPLLNGQPEERMGLVKDFLDQGSLERALAECNFVLRQNPMADNPAYEKARIELYLGRTEEAKKGLREIISRNPGHKSARKLLAEADKGYFPTFKASAGTAPLPE